MQNSAIYIHCSSGLAVHKHGQMLRAKVLNSLDFVQIQKFDCAKQTASNCFVVIIEYDRAHHQRIERICRSLLLIDNPPVILIEIKSRLTKNELVQASEIGPYEQIAFSCTVEQYRKLFRRVKKQWFEQYYATLPPPLGAEYTSNELLKLKPFLLNRVVRMLPLPALMTHIEDAPGLIQSLASDLLLKLVDRHHCQPALAELKERGDYQLSTTKIGGRLLLNGELTEPDLEEAIDDTKQIFDTTRDDPEVASNLVQLLTLNNDYPAAGDSIYTHLRYSKPQNRITNAANMALSLTKRAVGHPKEIGDTLREQQSKISPLVSSRERVQLEALACAVLAKSAALNNSPFRAHFYSQSLMENLPELTIDGLYIALETQIAIGNVRNVNMIADAIRSCKEEGQVAQINQSSIRTAYKELGRELEQLKDNLKKSDTGQALAIASQYGVQSDLVGYVGGYLYRKKSTCSSSALRQFAKIHSAAK